MATRGPQPNVTDREILQELENGGYPFDTASTLSERVNLSRQRLRKRLNRLAENGIIERAKVSGVVLYWSDSDSEP
jgi:DNA-binding Lrp family transcriptional regulator